MSQPTRVVAIVPCNDLRVSMAFYDLLGFVPGPGPTWQDYVILSDGKGGDLHLTKAPGGWLVPGKSPFGIYIYSNEVELLAERMGSRLLHPPEKKPWGMLEFAVSDPDENLVRVGRALVSR